MSKPSFSKHIGIYVGGGSFGGIERVLLNLGYELSVSGQNIDLIVTRKAKRLIDPKYKEAGCRIIDIGVDRVRYSIIGLIRYIKSAKPDILISGAPTNSILTIIAKYISLSSVKTILGIHCILSETRKESIFNWLIYFSMRLFYRFADKIIAGSEYAAKDFSKVTGIPIEKIDVIYNPVISDTILVESITPISHPWFDKSKQCPIIMGIGRMEKEKNFQLLVKAFANIRKIREVNLMLLGDGSKRKEIEDLIEQLNIKEYVSIEGFVNNPFPYIAKASLVVVPSLHEMFSCVLIEAMALGISIVATDCPGGNKEILGDGKYGKIVKTGDENDLAIGIMEMLDNPSKPDILKERSQLYSAKSIVKEYLDVVRKL